MLQDVFFVTMVYFVLFCFQHLFDLEQEMLQDVFFVTMVYFVLFVFSICLTWSRRCYRM